MERRETGRGKGQSETYLMHIRIAGIVPESYVDGPGIRAAVFLQGCFHDCPGCHNPSTHDPGGGKEMTTEEIFEEIKKNPLITGITITGGEPFLQATAAAEIAKQAKDQGLNVWTYTGHTYENLIKSKQKGVIALLRHSDVLVDGRFEERKKTYGGFRGSTNQRVIDLNKTRRTGKIEEWKKEETIQFTTPEE